MKGLHGKRLRIRKWNMNIGTWNVQGIRTKDEEVFKESDRYKLDIAVLSETKKKGQGILKTDNYILFYSGGNKDKRAKAGISVAIHMKWKRNVENWEAIKER